MKTRIKIKVKNIISISLAVIAGLLLGWILFSETDQASPQETELHSHNNASTLWTCSMHPQIKQDKPGKCPICGMDLIPLKVSSHDQADINPDAIILTDAAMKLAEVETIKVTEAVPFKEVLLYGKVEPDETLLSEVTARFGGRIEKLYVSYTGQKVSRGERLATIYSPALVTAQKELLETAALKQSYPALYQAARNKLRNWDLTDEQIDDLENNADPRLSMEVLSTVSGMVTKRNVAEGDYVKEGASLFSVEDLSRVWVMFDAYESDLPWLHMDDSVRFTVKAIPGQVFAGKISYIDPFLDPVKRIARVRVESMNKKGVLKPAMFANGIVSAAIGNKPALIIPASAVLWTGKRSVVYVRDTGTLQNAFNYREITLGPETDNAYMVMEGLDKGEEIAINGTFKIDAAAQLEGKPSMMNPIGNGGTPINTMPGMNMGDSPDAKSALHNAGAESSVQNKKKARTKGQTTSVMQHVTSTTHVSGNCEMCKEVIEKAALSQNGVMTADWNVDSKLLTIVYMPDMVNMDQIQKAIAETGYDTENFKGSDEAYLKLPECCHYRPE